MLNIKQLNISIDSISHQYMTERTEFEKNFLNNYPFLSEYDTLKKVPFMLDTVKHPADITQALGSSEKHHLIEVALMTASSVRDNAEMNRQTLYGKSKLLHKHQVVLHKKFTFSIACFLLFFIGAPLGAIIRKGGLGLPAVVSTIFFILFWILSFTGEKYTDEGVLPAWEGMWIAPAVLLPIGIFLTYKATIDASLLDIDSWIKLFYKIFRIKSGTANENPGTL